MAASNGTRAGGPLSGASDAGAFYRGSAHSASVMCQRADPLHFVGFPAARARPTSQKNVDTRPPRTPSGVIPLFNPSHRHKLGIPRLSNISGNVTRIRL